MKKGRTSSIVAAALALGLLAAACGGGGGGTGGAGGFAGVGLTGAGATFPDPIYETWFHDFREVESGAKINYQAIGSGGGVEQFTARTVDFGASDAPLKAEEAAALPGDALEIPTVLGGVVVAYHTSGLQDGLKLDAKTVADIFLGKVKAWNAPEIAALNEGADLPATGIQVVHRSDESGTTKVFTSWLAAGSPEWETNVGADKAVQWPTGTGGDGNDGVAAAISQTDGSIGYLSFDFAVSSGLGVAQLEREDGNFVSPSVDSITEAGGGLSFPIGEDTNILNSPAPGAYPMSTTTYLLVYRDLSMLGSRDKAQTLVDFLHWALTTGQDRVKELNYSPLPADIRKQALEQLGQLTFDGRPITPSGT